MERNPAAYRFRKLVLKVKGSLCSIILFFNLAYAYLFDLFVTVDIDETFELYSKYFIKFRVSKMD